MAAEDTNDAKLNRLVAAQLQKTKMCAMHQRGTCRDPKCRFAHSPEELRTPPNLTKTAICRMFTRGQCRNSSCKFAHGEQELRVTPSVYKTQLCNFHMRGHCKKGMRCRHAHGEEELRSFLSQASTSSPPRSPTPSDESTATGGVAASIMSEELDAVSSPYRSSGLGDEAGSPYEPADVALSTQELRALMSTPPGRWSPQDLWAAVLAAGGPGATRITTPPPGNMPYLPTDQLTPNKVVPPLPGSPDFAEPMKVELHSPGFSAPSPLGHASLLRENVLSHLGSGLSPLSTGENFEPLSRSATPHEDIGLIANAHLAWAAQAKMEYELAAAQLKVKELQAKRQMYNASMMAANASANGMLQGQESHFESIMQTLQKLPSRPASPNEMVPAQIRPVTPQPSGFSSSASGTSVKTQGSPVMGSPREGSRAQQPWHPTDISQKHSTAWVI